MAKKFNIKGGGKGSGSSGRGGAKKSAGRKSSGPGNKQASPQRSNRPSRKPERLEKSRGTWQLSEKATQVSGREGGLDLAHYLQMTLPGKQLGIRAIRRLLTSGCCRVNGQVESFGSRKLHRGDVVECDHRSAMEEQDDRFTKKRLLFDKDNIIAYDKPANLPVTATDDGKRWHLHRILQDEFGRLYPVHRLDADTSGIVLFARTEETAEALQEMFKEHLIKKTYRALVRGLPKEKGDRKTYIRCIEKQPGLEKWGTAKGPDAREAATSWQVEEQIGKFASLLKVEPATGRYHQIRIHLSEMGHPLFGDRLYGDRHDPVTCRRHMLHASVVTFKNPADGKIIKITCKLPKDFTDLIKELEKTRR